VSVTRKPLLVWDGDCDFCRGWIARWRRITGDRVEYATYQEVATQFPDLPRSRFERAVQLIEPDGEHSEAAEAVFRSLAYAPGSGWPLELYRSVPGFAAVSEWLYRLVADHRPAFTRLTRWVWGRHVAPPGMALTSWVFLRLLGFVYLVAFVSLWTQILGLAGHDGILPAREFLDFVRAQVGGMRYVFVPTLCWLNASDTFLNVVAGAGTAASLLLALGFVPAVAALVAWICYLSLATIGQDFLWFQWDSLLLETGFIVLFFAPWRLWSRPGADAPPRPALWLLRWLLFRLMLSSAAVKLSSGDPTWRNLTALTFHYETQPLPPWTAWYAHHWPVLFQKMSTVFLFAVEGLAPFLVFAPRRIRFAGAAALIGLQTLILLTGNYGVFNVLSIALCILLLDDGVWPWTWRRRTEAERVAPVSARWPRWILRPIASLLILISLVPFAGALGFRIGLGPITPLYRYASTMRMVSSYGLFAVMTTSRPEIIVSGSTDGVTWRDYTFHWKPGDLNRRPEFLTPHMPRLDWQMWFAALSDFRRESWFLRFCQRLLEGSKPVLALLERNPFPDGPPRYVRAVVYDYHFTDAATRRASGAWWRREERGLYCPVLTLVDGRLAPATSPGDERPR
jgi:lipase maturation factor 1